MKLAQSEVIRNLREIGGRCHTSPPDSLSKTPRPRETLCRLSARQHDVGFRRARKHQPGAARVANLRQSDLLSRQVRHGDKRVPDGGVLAVAPEVIPDGPNFGQHARSVFRGGQNQLPNPSGAAARQDRLATCQRWRGLAPHLHERSILRDARHVGIAAGALHRPRLLSGPAAQVVADHTAGAAPQNVKRKVGSRDLFARMRIPNPLNDRGVLGHSVGRSGEQRLLDGVCRYRFPARLYDLRLRRRAHRNRHYAEYKQRNQFHGSPPIAMPQNLCVEKPVAVTTTARTLLYRILPPTSRPLGTRSGIVRSNEPSLRAYKNSIRSTSSSSTFFNSRSRGSRSSYLTFGFREFPAMVDS